MKKIITLNLFKADRLENEYKDIKSIEKDSEYIFSLDGVKTVFGPTRFTRENEEYKFCLDIQESKGSYLLKEKNISFDIEVEKIMYKKEKNTIILEYKISSDEETFKIEIIEEDDINE
jgi:trehalose/maltose hydrolase-like predicted phosphorylase